jgi:hypothetical protein
VCASKEYRQHLSTGTISVGTAQKQSVGLLFSTSSALTNRVAPRVECRKKTREGEERG